LKGALAPRTGSRGTGRNVGAHSRGLPAVATADFHDRVGFGADFCRDVAGRTVATEQLSDVLREFARTMVTDFPIQGILDHLVKRIVDVMPVTGAGVTLIAPGLEPRYVAASDDSALRYEKLQTELGEGPCLAAYHAGEAIAVPDLTNDDRFPIFGPRAVNAGLAAVFTFPLNHDDLRLGALDLYRDTRGGLSEESMGMAQTLADVAAAYLINAQARSDLQDSSDQSREAALHDALTGLPNRVLMLQLLQHAFRRGRRSGHTTAVFFLDLDEFKAVNDTYGHKVGDELLVAVAKRLTGVLRPGDSLARLSGDEFVVLCEDLEDPSGADGIAARFADALATPFDLSGLELQIDASIGIAFTGHGSDAPEELIHDADLAMYRTKRHRDHNHRVLDLRELTSPSTRPVWRAACPAPLYATSCTSNTSRLSAHARGGSPEWRRCCAGRTRAAGRFHPRCSSRSLNNPAKSLN
jgi:diguanylate cyclase (GGDEF)-like protein